MASCMTREKYEGGNFNNVMLRIFYKGLGEIVLYCRGSDLCNCPNTPKAKGVTMQSLSFQSVLFRLFLAMLFSSVIGWEREFNSRPAGIRTNVMVCVGVTIVAMIQMEIINMVLGIAISNPGLEGVVRADPVRLICQVVIRISTTASDIAASSSANNNFILTSP